MRKAWRVLKILKISQYGEKALLNLGYFSFHFQSLFLKNSFNSWTYCPHLYLLKSLDHCPLQHVAKIINCLDSMKTCNVVVFWSKILFLSWKTFCLLNCDVASTIERPKLVLSSYHKIKKKKKKVKSLLIIWCSLLWGDKNAKQRENKWLFNVTWESEKVVTSLSDLWREFFTESDN